jgi:protein-disulfide isomerase
MCYTTIYMKNPWTIIGLITVVLFGGAIWYGSSANEKNNEGVQIIEHVAGNKDALVTLVEYSDLQCPACAAFQPVVKSLLEEYSDRIRFEYKHFPLVALHPFAIQAAVASEAAGQQGKFFEFHDVLFANQTEWANSSTPNIFFIKYAEELGLDVATFRRHMNSSILEDRVRSQFDEGRELGAKATPSFFLNGEFLNPDEFQTYQGFIEAVVRAIDPNLVSTSTEAAIPEVKFGI